MKYILCHVSSGFLRQTFGIDIFPSGDFFCNLRFNRSGGKGAIYGPISWNESPKLDLPLKEFFEKLQGQRYSIRTCKTFTWVYPCSCKSTRYYRHVKSSSGLSMYQGCDACDAKMYHDFSSKSGGSCRWHHEFSPECEKNNRELVKLIPDFLASKKGSAGSMKQILRHILANPHKTNMSI